MHSALTLLLFITTIPCLCCTNDTTNAIPTGPEALVEPSSPGEPVGMSRSILACAAGDRDSCISVHNTIIALGMAGQTVKLCSTVEDGGGKGWADCIPVRTRGEVLR